MPYSKKQADVIINANARWNILAGAVRSGKTWASFDLIVRRIAELPDGDRVMIGRTQQTLERNVINPLRKRLGTAYVTTINSRNTVRIAGKPFYVLGADNKEAVAKLQGLGLVYAYGDEITTWNEGVFQMLKSRLSDTGALFDGTCNPEGPSHWLKKDVLDRTDLDVRQWHFVLDDNPFLPPDFVRNLKREYSGVFYDRYVLGKWVKAEGVVYQMFEVKAHVIAAGFVPKIHKIAFAVDVGHSNATVFLAIGTGDDGRAYVLAEYYHSGKAQQNVKSPLTYAKDYTALKKRIMAQYPLATFEGVFVDPSALGFKQQLRELGEYQVYTANNDVVPGIQTVQSVIDSDLLRVCVACEKTIDEFNDYVWDEKASKRGEDQPVKDNDHCMDALRYYFHTNRRDWIGRRLIGVA